MGVLMRKKLDFFVGEWHSVSVNQDTGAESSGHSLFQWGIGGAWLQWEFSAQLEGKPLKVLTLINYDDEKKRYVFYSFNPFDREPIPHYGDWLDEHTLRIETDFQGEYMRVDIVIKGSDEFYQEHSKLTSSGERVSMSKTYYSRIK